MNEISIGAIGAASIAGLVSMLGLIIGKEQKVSEFRQAWINELRKCVVDYLVNINAICDIVRLNKSGPVEHTPALLNNYKLLNEANHGITLRINDSEKPAKDLLNLMKEFEAIAKDNNSLTPEKIIEIESRFIMAAKSLLKFEWNRVKKGERVFVWSKNTILASLLLMLSLLAFTWYTNENEFTRSKANEPEVFVATEGG